MGGPSFAGAFVFAIRCTESLLARIATVDDSRVICDAPPAPDTVLGDWHVERLAPAQLLCTSSSTLLSVITPAEPFAELPARLRAAVSDVLEVLRIPAPRIARELKQMRWVQFAPTTDPRMHALMDRLLVAAHADAASESPAASPVELAVRLGAMALGTPLLGDGVPIKATQALFGVPADPGDARAALDEEWIEGASPD